MKKTIVLLCIFLGITISVLYGEVPNLKPIKSEPINQNYVQFIGKKSGSDAFGYEYLSTQDGDSVTFNWIEISGTGIPVTLGDDDFDRLELSFAFQFYNNFYDSIDIQSNGTITFHGDYFGYGNTDLPTNSYNGPWDVICANWDDLDPSAFGQVYFQDFGTYAVIEFASIPLYGGTLGNTFQIILYDNGNIKLQYLDFNEYNNATIGIQDNTAYVNTNNWYIKYLYNSLPIAHIPTNSTAILIIYPHYDYDIGVVNIEMDDKYSTSSSVIPIVKLYNFGNNAMAGPLFLEIDSSGTTIYSESNIISINPLETKICTFNIWNVGPKEYMIYNISANINFAGDENLINDSLQKQSIVTYPISWDSCTDRITAEQCQATAFNPDNQKLYSFGGYHKNGTMTDAAYEYNPANDSWTTLSNMLEPLYWIDGSYANGEIFILGGHDNITSLSISMIYNVANDSFRYGTNINYAVLAPSIITYNDSLIYCLGGQNASGSRINNVQIYDAYNNAVYNATSMINTLARGGAAITDSIIWIIGGQGAGAFLYYGIINSNDCTDISWYIGDALPASNVWGNGATSMYRDNQWYLYLVGGYQNGSASNKVWEYSVSRGEWLPLEDYPTILVRNDFTAASSDLRTIFVTGGDYTGSLNETRETWKLTWPPSSFVEKSDINIYDNFGFREFPKIVNNDLVEIKYSLKENGYVTLEIFDISGRLVKTLVKDSYNRNDYSVYWNISDESGNSLPSGIYMFKLKTNNDSQFEKLIYLK